MYFLLMLNKEMQIHIHAAMKENATLNLVANFWE